MNMKRRLLATILAAAAGATLSAAVPEVTGVTMTQANDRLVTINYTLSDAPAVVTLDIQTNATGDTWASIGGEGIWNAMGDVWKRVETGSRTITWHPDHSWPDHKVADGGARAVVTAWALENTPDYMVVDLVVSNTVRYYPGSTSMDSSLAPSQGGTAIVGSYKPSDWGLYDMHGNVFELCLDWYETNVKEFGGRVNIDFDVPGKTLSGAQMDGTSASSRTRRGGAFSHAASNARAGARLTARADYNESDPHKINGIRVVCTAGLR